MKKILSLLLISSMLLSLSACGNTAPDSPDTADTADTTTKAVETSELDRFKADYGGDEFRIITNCSPDTTWYTTNVTVCESDPDAMSSAIYRRNMLVEKNLNVRLTETYMLDTVIRQSILAGDDIGELTLLHGTTVMPLAQDGGLIDLNTLPHQDFSAEWWDTNAAEQLSINGKLFMGVGDFVTTPNDQNIVMLFNKKLIDDHKLESPYELVKSEKWTLDKMAEMGAVAMRENGDLIYNDRDTYGLSGHQYAMYIYLIAGSGEAIVTKDENDIPAFTFNSNAFTDAFLKVLEIVHGGGDGFIYDANVNLNTRGLADNHDTLLHMFPNNQSLFLISDMGNLKALRSMNADFGILPCPKISEDQAEYYNLNNGSFYGITVPITVTDTERVSFVLEALNAYSVDTVKHAYYDLTLESKITRDEESLEMLDIIFDNIIYDFSVCYFIERARHNICDKVLINDPGIASLYAGQISMLDAAIDKIVQSFD